MIKKFSVVSVCDIVLTDNYDPLLVDMNFVRNSMLGKPRTQLSVGTKPTCGFIVGGQQPYIGRNLEEI